MLIVESERFPGMDHNVAVETVNADFYYDPAKSLPTPVSYARGIKTVEWFIRLPEVPRMRWSLVDR